MTVPFNPVVRAVLALSVTGVSLLRGQASSRIFGQVLDISMASVPTALITADNAATGLHREARASTNGYYSIPGLPIGTYRLVVSSEGFQSVWKDVVVGVAQNIEVRFRLEPQTGIQSIEVHAEARSDAAGNVDAERIGTLPINGRDYTRFTFLAPGSLPRSGQVADLSFNGMHSVHNQFSIDGIDATRVDVPYVANGAERGARLLTGSLDSIAEIRIETANYRPEFGRTAGAYVNIVTKSGSNLLHGTVFGYVRNSSLDARNFFNAKPAPQAPFRYWTPGANLAGPIRRDSTFLFANYEGSRQSLGVAGSGTVPSSALRSAVLKESPALKPIVDAMPAGARPTADPRVDLFTTTQTLTIREDTGSLKLDRHIGRSNTANVRLNFNDSRVEGPLYATQSNALGLSDRQDVPVRTVNAALTDQHSFSSKLLNEFQAGMQRVRTHLITDTPREPLVTITGLTIAPGSRGRGLTTGTSYQLSDNVTFVAGSHTVKIGIAARNLRLVQSSADLAILTFTSIDEFIANRIAVANIAAGNPGSATWSYEVGSFAQDSWQVYRNLTLDAGCRYDRFSPPFDPQRRARSFDSRTGSLAEAGAPLFQTNGRNIAPRLGFAWQMLSHLTIRGGFGIYYQAYPVGYGSIAGNTLPGTTTLRSDLIPRLSYPLPSVLTSGIAAKPGVTGFEWDKPDASSSHWGINAEWIFHVANAVRVGYTGNRGVHLRRNMNINLIDPAPGRPPNDSFSSINLETATGNSNYHALELTWTRRVASPIVGSMNYIWSHAIDDVADPAVTASAHPQDNANLRAERGNGASDVRHRLSYSWLYNIPNGRHWSSRGWLLASAAYVRSGMAQTILIGTNTSGTGNLVNQRPDAVSGVSPYAADRPADRWFNPAAFRLPARGTFGNLGRNTAYGPKLIQVDASLVKQTRITETTMLQFRLDAFNVLNHPNFALPQSTFGTAAFGRILSTVGNTMGFGTARQIQLALRLNF